MIVVLQPHGQLCNRLLQYSWLAAISKQHHVAVYNPTFAPFDREFPRLGDREWLRASGFKLRSRPALPGLHIGSRVLSRAGDVRFGAVRLSSVGRAEFSPWSAEHGESARHGVLLLTGWAVRDGEAVLAHAADIRALFQLSRIRALRAQALVGRYREGRSALVAVHVRRRDYRAWKGGRFYYTDRQYEAIIERIAQQLSRDARFVVTTDEPESLGPGLLPLFEPAGDALDDLCLLSACDLIVGPPSTFSGWASFAGNVPLLHVSDPASVDVEQASVYSI